LTTSTTQQFCETSSIFQADNINNTAILRDSQFLKLTMSKTKQFCETSSISKLTTSETKQLCETSFKNGKLNAERPRANAFCFAIFPFHLFKVLRLPRKSEARSSAAPVTQKHLKQI